MRDLPYLEDGAVPLEDSGLEVTKLDYTGEEHEKLTESDVRDLAYALLDNDEFRGEL